MEYNNNFENSDLFHDFVKNLNKFNYTKKFLEKRKIFFWGPVYSSSAENLINQLLFLETENPGKEITFYINSPGGSVVSGMAVYDTMQMISSPISTVCLGMAASMGSILLSGGEKGKRFIFPHGEVMIHQPSLGGYFQDQASNLEITAKQIKKTKIIGAKILANNCGHSTEKVLKDFDRDYWMDAKESIEYGIVDSMVEKLII